MQFRNPIPKLQEQDVGEERIIGKTASYSSTAAQADAFSRFILAT
jgi:hypothetical protein